MKADITSRPMTTPCHVTLETYRPLYLHITKTAKTGSFEDKHRKSASHVPCKAHWVPPPGRTTLKAKYSTQRHPQFAKQAVDFAKLSDAMELVGNKVQQLEDLISSLQETMEKKKDTILNEKDATASNKSLVESYPENFERNFLKLHREQQQLIRKCLEVIEMSKRILRQSHDEHRPVVKDASAQVPLSPIHVTEAKKGYTALSKDDNLKLKTEIGHLKNSLRLAKEEIHNSKEDARKHQNELLEKNNLLKKLAAERDTWKIMLTRVVNEKLETETQITFMKNLVHNLQSEVSSLVKETVSRATVNELQDENENLQTAKTILENQVLNACNEISDLKYQINKLNLNLQSTDVKTSSAELKDVGCQATSVPILVNEIIVQEKKEKMEDFLTIVAKLELDLAEKTAAINNLNQKLQSKELEVSRLIDKLEVVTTEMHNERVKWKGREAGLEASLQSKRAEVSELKTKQLEVEATCSRKLDQVEKKLQSLQTTNLSLRNYISLLRNSYAAVFSDPMVGTSLYPFPD